MKRARHLRRHRTPEIHCTRCAAVCSDADPCPCCRARADNQHEPHDEERMRYRSLLAKIKTMVEGALK